MPTQTPNKVNSYKYNNNIKGDIQEDTEIYPNYLKGLKGYSKVEVSLYKLIEDDSETEINSP